MISRCKAAIEIRHGEAEMISKYVMSCGDAMVGLGAFPF